MEVARRLDDRELNDALKILKTEHDANVPSRKQRISFMLLKITAFAFPVLFLVTVIVVRPQMQAGEEQNWWQATLTAATAIDIIAIPVLCLLNMGFAWRLFRERRMMRKSGFADLINEQWKSVKKRRSFLDSVQLALGVIAALLFGLLLISVPILLSTEREGERMLRWESLAAMIVGSAVVLLTPIFVYLTGRLRQKLELIDGLRRSLLTYQNKKSGNSSNGADIPIHEYNVIAQVERAQIDRSRAESIRGGARIERADSFVLRKSGSVRDSLQAMDMESNLHVQEHIEELTVHPKPENSLWDSASGHYFLTLDDVPARVEYSVDERRHIIDIVAVESTRTNTISHTDRKA